MKHGDLATISEMDRKWLKWPGLVKSPQLFDGHFCSCLSVWLFQFLVIILCSCVLNYSEPAVITSVFAWQFRVLPVGSRLNEIAVAEKLGGCR